MSVLAPHDGFRAVAEAVADDRREPLVGSLDAVPEGRCVYVAPLEALDVETVGALQSRLLADGPRRGGFSVVTGETPEVARRLYFRSPTDRRRHALLLRDTGRDWFSYDADAEVATGSDVSVEFLRERAGDLASLSLHAHGRAMHVFLADGYLCGFPEGPEAASFPGSQPYCVAADGTLDCPLEGELLHADELTVPHVFLDSCASLVPRSDGTGLPVHVGRGLLRGARSVVAGYRRIRSLPQLSALNYCLLRAGYDLVQRCYLLNHAARAANTAAVPYVPFGRPEATFADPTAGTAEWSVDGGHLTVEQPDVHVLDVALPGFPGAEDLYVRNVDPDMADVPLYYVPVPDEEGGRVLVYTWGRLSTDRLEFEVSREPADHGTRRIVVDAARNLRRARQLGLTDNKLAGQLKDLRTRLDGLADSLAPQRYDANAHWGAIDQLEGIDGRVLDMGERLLDRLEDRQSAFLSDGYGKRLDATAVAATDARCPDCSRPLFVRRYEHPLGDAAREEVTCPRCGTLCDVPEGGHRPAVRGDLELLAGDAASFEVTFANERDLPVRATFRPWLGSDDDAHRGADVFDPGRERRPLAPGESVAVSFEVDVGALDPNEYWLCVFVAANLRVYQAIRRFVPGERTGHVPDSRRADP